MIGKVNIMLVIRPWMRLRGYLMVMVPRQAGEGVDRILIGSHGGCGYTVETLRG